MGCGASEAPVMTQAVGLVFGIPGLFSQTTWSLMSIDLWGCCCWDGV